MMSTGIIFVPTVLLNNFLFHADGSYGNQFTFSIAAIFHHAVDYLGFFSYAFANPLSNRYRYVLWALTLVPVGFGIVKRLRAGVSVTELYVLTLLGIDFVYWATNPRYLLPIMPIYLVYMVEGFQAIAQKFPAGVARAFKAAAAVALLFPAAANAFLMRPDPKDTLVMAPAFEQLCTVVRNQTEKNALLIFWNPRVLALSTARSASGWPAEGKQDEITRYLGRLHPQYVITDTNDPDDRRFLIPYLSSASPAGARTVYENSRFRLVRLVENNRQP
jgi:hypothetical protein